MGYGVYVYEGGTSTDMWAVAPQQQLDIVINSSPFKRMGNIGDVSDFVLLLVSDSARWISGEAINVSGAAK
jgi:NAD(P)-dependent dehydrogenase (short-subunit alcohol dehydrogenase family)